MLKSIPALVQEIRANLRCIDASTAMEEIKKCNGVLIDVREPAEFAEKPAPLSTNIPRGLIEMKVATMFPKEDTPIYLHCATGARATFAGEQLQRMGYNTVSVITCSLDEVCSQQERR